jgi:hypothetical protein
MRWILWMICLAAPLLHAGDASNGALPKEDMRAIRQLQDLSYGKPTLAADAPRQEALLALADLGATAASSPSSALTADDKAALFSLLQRYRDELLALGMDAAEMDTELKVLESRSAELERRLANLYPKDGLKISGRFYSAFDDLHLLGNAAVPAVSSLSVPKGAGESIRNQVGVVHGELKLSGTRGPVSAYAQLDIVDPWGIEFGSIGFRKVYLELRMPVTLQFGDIDAAVTPLTLWRNDDHPWFEPEPLRSRRQRMEDDLLLVPDKWAVKGARATTEVHLSNSVDLELESISSIAANPGAPVYQLAGDFNDKGLGERYSTYMEAWSAGLAMGPAFRLAYNGNLFWDETSTAPDHYGPMQETVQSGSVKGVFGALSLNAEAAISSYLQESLTYTAQTAALTGTALSAAATWMLTDGYLKVFGRSVSSGFHAAGAQGRTVDYSYQPLGPFLTEQSNVNAVGGFGLDPFQVQNVSNRIKLSLESQLNDQLIPPGVYDIPNVAPNPVSGGTWQNLLAYGPGEEIDPYGEATPNRQGFGSELQWGLFNGGLKPMASYESFQQIDDAVDGVGNTLSPFVMNRIRAGLEVDLEPWTAWPVRFGGGYTSTDSSNGQKDALGHAYDLSTTLTDASVELWAGKPLGLAFGYRQMLAKGQDDTMALPGSSGTTWDIIAAGGWWRPQPGTTVDLVYSTGHSKSPDLPASDLETDETLLRLTTEF